MRIIRKPNKRNFNMADFDIEEYIDIEKLKKLYDIISRGKQNISANDINDRWFNTGRGKYSLLTDEQKSTLASTVSYQLEDVAYKISRVFAAQNLYDLENRCDSLTDSFDKLLELLEEYVVPHSPIYRYITPYAKEPLF